MPNTSKKRTFVSFPITDFQFIKQQMLSWASRFNICCFLDNHSYQFSNHSLECLLAAGSIDSIRLDTGVASSAGSAFDRLMTYSAGQKDWLFGHFGYGLSRETEPPEKRLLPSVNTIDPIGFPDLFFFVPQILIELTPDSIRIGSCQNDHAFIFSQIREMDIHPLPPDQQNPAPVLRPRFAKEEYLATVAALRQHILRGDCYEINFCQEFFSQPAVIDPLHTWFSLGRTSPSPFAAFYKVENSHLLCASPERYLKRIGNTLLSQPIKGTSPRFPDDPAQDRASRDELYNSSKDRSENVMVVDLVRNDLSKICLPGSVGVEELYGIYSFPQVHQMISTIRGELPAGTHWVEVIRNTFPMGSMTGAPKNRVVGLIDRYERTARGIFSGSVGYVSPDGDFDFNVVIRSILYNASTEYLSYQVGSGITFYSDPEKEYEECLWKAEGMTRAMLPG